MTDEDPFLYPNELEISDAEYDALIEILGWLEHDQFVHAHDHLFGSVHGFNMNSTLDSNGQCALGCIGGWMYAIMWRNQTSRTSNAYKYVRLGGHSEALTKLFYPESDEYLLPDIEQITPAMALKAVTNFLMTGDPDWPSACFEDDTPPAELASA